MSVKLTSTLKHVEYYTIYKCLNQACNRLQRAEIEGFTSAIMEETQLSSRMFDGIKEKKKFSFRIIFSLF